MSGLAMLKEAAACGVRLSLNGDNLAIKTSAKPSAALLAKLKANKSEIVALLRQEAALDSPPEPELFDVPRGDGTSGLIWFLKGEPVRSSALTTRCLAMARTSSTG